MHLTEAHRVLEPVVTDFHDANYSTAGHAASASEEAVSLGTGASESLRESLVALSTYVTKSNEALRNGQEALNEVQGVKPLESLTLPAMGEVKDRLAKAEALFDNATKAASQAIAIVSPDLLKPGLGLLSRYTKSSKEAVEGVRKAQERTDSAKTSIDHFFGEGSYEPIPQRTALFTEQLKDLATDAMEANDHIIADVGDGDANADPPKLDKLIEDLGVSLSFMRSAIDKPLGTFVMIVKDANNKVTAEDLHYLEGVINRTKQGVAAHQAVSQEGKRLGDVANTLRIAVLDFLQDV